MTSRRYAEKQQQMIDAASAIAHEFGAKAITVGAVAQRTGIARTTVYDYFPSVADLIADVVVDDLGEMIQSLELQLSSCDSPLSVVQQWMRAMLNYIVDGKHKLVREALSIDLPPTRKAQIGELHAQMMNPLMNALRDAGVKDARRVASQIYSIADVCARRIETGNPAAEEIEAAEEFVIKALSL